MHCALMGRMRVCRVLGDDRRFGPVDYMRQETLTRKRWCPRCEEYTEQNRDVVRWRRSKILSIFAFPYTLFEDMFSTWFCENCRRSVRPFER